MFERFNNEARALIVRSQEQARSLGHNYIGTEHLLLGLLVGEPAGSVAAGVLEDAGLRHDEVRAMVLDIVGPGEGAGTGHIPFTPRSKKVLELSLREAMKLRHKYIGPEHVLLGLVREGEGVAAQIMVKQGAAFSDVRQAVLARAPALTKRRAAFGSTRPPFLPPSAGGLTAGALRATNLASVRAGGGPIGSQHYLLGLLDEREGLAAKALGALGVTRETIEAKLAELGPEGTTDEPPERAGARATQVEVQGDEISVRILETDLAARLRSHFEGSRSGAELPGSEQLWKALRQGLEEMTVRLEAAGDLGWVPPGFGKAGVASFAVVSQAGGLSCQLWTATGVDPQEAREWLAGWFTTKGVAGPPDRCAFISVSVGRMGDVVPEAADPGAFTICGVTCGPGGPGFGGKAVPIGDLVSAAIAHLTSGGAPPAT